MLYNHFVSTIQNAKCMVSPAFNLKCICNCFPPSDEQIEHIPCSERENVLAKLIFNVIGDVHDDGSISLCSRNYGSQFFSAWVCVALNLLGSYISETGQGLNILVVGSGDARTLRMMCEKNRNVSATTIDPTKMFRCVSGHEIPVHRHIFKKWKDVNSDDLELNGYDVIVIDVEPHANENQIYEHFYPFLKSKHIIYCECLLQVGCYSYCLFTNLLSWLQHRKIAIDYFAILGFSIHDYESGYFSNRDGWIFCDKETDKNYDESQKNIISKQLPSNSICQPFSEGVNLFLCKRHHYN